MYNLDTRKKALFYIQLERAGILKAVVQGMPIEVYSYTEQKWLDCPRPNFGILPASCYRVKDESAETTPST